MTWTYDDLIFKEPTEPIWKQDSWELANGHIEYISEDEKRELQNMPFFT